MLILVKEEPSEAAFEAVFEPALESALESAFEQGTHSKKCECLSPKAQSEWCKRKQAALNSSGAASSCPLLCKAA